MIYIRRCICIYWCILLVYILSQFVYLYRCTWVYIDMCIYICTCVGLQKHRHLHMCDFVFILGGCAFWPGRIGNKRTSICSFFSCSCQLLKVTNLGVKKYDKSAQATQTHILYIQHMDVSKNRGTPKWMVKIMVPNPMNKWMIWGVFPPIFGNTRIPPTKRCLAGVDVFHFQSAKGRFCHVP